MSATGVVFRKIGDRIVPIGAKSAAGKGAAKVAGAAAGATAKTARGAKGAVKAHKSLAIASTAAAIASGVVAGFAFGPAKQIALGHSVSLGLDVAGTGAAAAAYAGKGKTGERAKSAAKLEAFNYAVGYGTFGAVALANPVARKQIIGWASKAITVGKAFGKRIIL